MKGKVFACSVVLMSIVWAFLVSCETGGQDGGTRLQPVQSAPLKQTSVYSDPGIDEGGEGGTSPTEGGSAYTPPNWDIEQFTHPVTGETFDIIAGRVLIAFKNPPLIPDMDPNYFDEPLTINDPYYDGFEDGYPPVVGDPEVDAFLATENLEVITEWPPLRGISVELPPETSVAEAILMWPAEYPELVEHVDPDAIVEDYSWPLDPPNDDEWDHVWALNPDSIYHSPYDINIVEAWQSWYIGSPSVVVAVIDSGVQRGHMDLDANLTPDGINVGDRFWYHTDTFAGLGAGQPRRELLELSQAHATSLGHGTCIAGIIAADIDNDGNGVLDDKDAVGVSQENRILPIAVDKDMHEANAFSSSTAMVNAYLALGIVKGVYFNFSGVWPFPSYNVEAVNCSYGSSYPTWLEIMLVNRLGRYMLFVCASGNDGLDECYRFPAAAPLALCVSLYRSNGERNNWNFLGGNYASYTGVLAPGDEILTTDMYGYTSNGYGLGWNYGWNATEGINRDFQGTSAAAPFVSGVAAMMSSQWYFMTPAQIKSKIMSTTTKDLDWDYRRVGRLNAYEAIDF